LVIQMMIHRSFRMICFILFIGFNATFLQGQHFLFSDSLLNQMQSRSENIEKLRNQYIRQLPQSRNPESLHIKIAGTYLMQSRWPEARSHYRRALRQQPNDLQINGLIALSYEQEDKPDSALMIIEPIAVMHPDIIALQFKAASLSEQISDYNKAIHFYRQWKRLDSQNPWVETCLGRVHEKMGEPDSARAAYLMSDKKGGTARSSYKLLIESRRQADTSLARMYQERVVEHVVSEIIAVENRWKPAPENPFSNYTLQRDQTINQDELKTMLRNVVYNWIPSSASVALESQITALLKKYPDAPLLLEQLAYVYKAQNKWDQAIRVYKQHLSLNPRSAIGLKNLGSIYEKQGQWLDAFRIYQRGLALDMENPEFYPLIIRTAKKADCLKRLSDRWERLYQAHHDNSLLKRNLIAVYYQLGQNDQAEALLHDFDK